MTCPDIQKNNENGKGEVCLSRQVLEPLYCCSHKQAAPAVGLEQGRDL